MVPLSLWYSRRFGAFAEHCINTRRLLSPVVWVVGSVLLFRCEPCFATCPGKSKDNHPKHDIVPATYAVFEIGSCPACRKLARVRGNVSIAATIGGLTSRCRSHPPKTRTVTRIVAPTSSIPVTVVADRSGPETI